MDFSFNYSMYPYKMFFFSLDLWKKRVSYLPSLLHVHFLPFGDRFLNLTADSVTFLLSFWNVEIITMSNSLFSSRSTMKRCLYRESTYLSSRIQLSETGSIQASLRHRFLFLFPSSIPLPAPCVLSHSTPKSVILQGNAPNFCINLSEAVSV